MKDIVSLSFTGVIWFVIGALFGFVFNFIGKLGRDAHYSSSTGMGFNLKGLDDSIRALFQGVISVVACMLWIYYGYSDDDRVLNCLWFNFFVGLINCFITIFT